MYENLIAFLLGKKDELTDEDLNEFIDLLNLALETTEEYEILEKTMIVDRMVDKAKISDKAERAAISEAIGNILQVEESESEELNIFNDTNETTTPLRSRKLKRGKFNKSGLWKSEDNKNETTINLEKREFEDIFKDKDETHILEEDLLKSTNTMLMDDSIPKRKNIVLFNNDKEPNIPSEKPLISEIFSINSQETAENTTKYKFEIGELEENHNEGPEVEFNLSDDE